MPSTVGFSSYIPVGCLVLSEADSGLPYDQWSLPDRRNWCYFGNDAGVDTDNTSFLPAEVQTLLLDSPLLSQYLQLINRKWIRVSFSISHDNPTLAIIRVLILADDLENRLVPRSDNRLRKQRQKLVNQLDFSSDIWNGAAGTNSGSTSSPPNSDSTNSPAGTDSEDGNPSLLQLFNNIPSPNPSIEDVEDHDHREAVCDIFESNVPGLNTTLYPYQRRSVAVMLQRESNSKQVLDPRLVKLNDHSEAPYYYDPVAGIILREPRFYDSPRGSILAEEMGSGKTLMCLALCLASKHIPAKTPEEYRTSDPVIRPKVASLADLVAACITKNSVPWKKTFCPSYTGEVYYDRCLEAIRRNPGFYSIPRLPSRRTTRFSRTSGQLAPSKVYLSHASLLVVPPNLVEQWKDEMAKHTSGLNVLTCVKRPSDLPPVEQLLEYDIILFSSTGFDTLKENLRNQPDGKVALDSPLAELHFKRCIIDEGHRLGNSTSSHKLDLQLVLDSLHITSRWVVTGTPSKGLYGINDSSDPDTDDVKAEGTRQSVQSSVDLEKDDLKRIGAIATLYLKVRPWANTGFDEGDTPADWSLYVIQQWHSRRGVGRSESLRATLESLIIRHRLSEMADLLPVVNEKIVYLDPSYQDILILNLFSTMIIFNSVQSQRTDQDYFFHPRQRKALIQLASNLRQASFFGGSFYSREDILKAVETAETFLSEGRVQISAQDHVLLREAIRFGRFAAENTLKNCANQCHEVPVYIRHLPFVHKHWSLDYTDSDPVCMNTRMIATLQKAFLKHQGPWYNDEYISRVLVREGEIARSEELHGKDSATTTPPQQTVLAGNTQLGEDKSLGGTSIRSVAVRGVTARLDSISEDDEDEYDKAPRLTIPPPFAQTQMVSTASAKLSYLVDQIVEHHHHEQILVFYDNDNIAFYLAEMLEVLRIQHLIYAKGLSTARRAQYVATFNHNPKFRVLLMDLSQAAFGLDMRSASRIYFINPVLNPQVEAQAIGRARRIGQIRPVTVETLVLRDSLEEVILRRRKEMTQEEQRKCHSILDDRPIYDWILNAKIRPLPGWPNAPSGPDQMAKLKTPQLIFGRGAGREAGDLDEPTVDSVSGTGAARGESIVSVVDGPEEVADGDEPPRKRVRFADA